MELIYSVLGGLVTSLITYVIYKRKIEQINKEIEFRAFIVHNRMLDCIVSMLEFLIDTKEKEGFLFPAFDPMSATYIEQMYKNKKISKDNSIKIAKYVGLFLQLEVIYKKPLMEGPERFTNYEKELFRNITGKFFLNSSENMADIPNQKEIVESIKSKSNNKYKDYLSNDFKNTLEVLEKLY